MSSVYDEPDLFNFVMRLPEHIAVKLREDLDSTVPLENKFFIQFNPNKRQAEIVYENQLLHGRIMDLPCIVEILKTLDRKTFYKSGDIGQIMICNENESSLPEIKFPVHALNQENLDKQFQLNHGLTPPLKNVRKKRFRKTLKKKNMDWNEVTKEVKKLIRDDMMAEKVEWELLYTDEDVAKSMSRGAALTDSLGRLIETDATNVEGTANEENKRPHNERYEMSALFGDMSDLEDDEDDEEGDYDDIDDSILVRPAVMANSSDRRDRPGPSSMQDISMMDTGDNSS